MKVVGFAAYSGAGKTTLLEALVALLVAEGETVAVIKHAHHAFDIDTPGKDSWRHRRAGASEVLVVSDRRMALMREFAEGEAAPSLDALIAQIDARTDWLLIEGFRGSALPKIEVWRAPTADFKGHPALYPDDPAVVAVAVDDATRLPIATVLPLLDLNQPLAVLRWMQVHAARFAWTPAQAACTMAAMPTPMPMPNSSRPESDSDSSHITATATAAAATTTAIAAGQRPALTSLDDARAQLLSHALPLDRFESIGLLEADGRVLAEDVQSPLAVPPADNSAMDGYALRIADWEALAAGRGSKPGGDGDSDGNANANAGLGDRNVDITQAGALPVSQRIAAGGVATPLAPGSAARIFTGAPIPAGADTVVMQEHCTALEGGTRVRIDTVPAIGNAIRLAGEDVRIGACVLARGDRLTPAALGMAASIGRDRLRVAGRPRVALFSTGDELVLPGAVAPDAMPPGAIYNSSRYFLHALLRRCGCDVTDMGVVADDFDATVRALRDASMHHDLVLTSGGVSVGEEDHVKPAVQSLGELTLWQIAMKPGKPFAYGKVGAAHFIGLPGNPVSSFVTFLLMVRPFLLALQGARHVAPAPIWLPAEFAWPKADKRREFLRVMRTAAGGLALFPSQGSGVLSSLVACDGLVDNPAGQTIAPGDPVRFISMADWLG